MIGISIQFLTGRYHATPWDKQVNEGAVEWPPSPWRIMRALISAYYRSPAPPEKKQVSRLLEKLAAKPPTYHVPMEMGSAHMQHYMPLRKQATTKIYDTFYVFPGGASLDSDSDENKVVVSWAQVQLEDAEQDILRSLCEGVSYLGRAESWAELLVVNDETKIDLCGMKPITVADAAQGGDLQVLCPLSAEKAAGFCLAMQTMMPPTTAKKGSKKASSSTISKLPQTLMDLLELDINTLYQQGWNGIPGAQWVSYTEPEKTTVRLNNSAQSRQPYSVNMARYALSCTVLPSISKAVSVGERFRRSLMSRTKDEGKSVSPTFSGKNPDRDVNQEESNFAIGHQHAYYLPEVNRATGKIEQIVVFSAQCFNARDLTALGRLSKVWGDGNFEIITVLMSLGKVADFVVARQQSSPIAQVIGCSKHWQSLTPMVLPRHSKKRYIPDTQFLVDGVEDQALRLLSQLPHLDLPEMAIKREVFDHPGVRLRDRELWLAAFDRDDNPIVRVRTIDEGVTQYRSGAFQKSRYHGEGKKASDAGYWLELEFAQLQSGPIAIGYAAHFGLGVFSPV
jgi:CRISPR-associated protein Csb2